MRKLLSIWICCVASIVVLALSPGSPSKADMLQAIVNATTAGAACTGTWTTNVVFRDLSTFVTDGSKTAYDLSTSSYPHSPATNGGTLPDATSIGWTSSTLGNTSARSRNASLDARIAGLAFVTAAIGDYDMLLGCQKHCSFAMAQGDPSNTNGSVQIVLRDGAGGSTLTTIGSPTSVSLGNYMAADASINADSSTGALGTTISVTYTQSIAEFHLPVPGSGTNPLQYLSLTCTP